MAGVDVSAEGIRLDADGCGELLYPSGRLCGSISAVTRKFGLNEAGQLTLFYTDSDRPRTILSLDAHGVGSISRPDGRQHIVVTPKGGRVVDEEGNEVEAWVGVRKGQPIECDFGHHVKVVFKSRLDCTLEFRPDTGYAGARVFQVGGRMLRDLTGEAGSAEPGRYASHSPGPRHQEHRASALSRRGGFETEELEELWSDIGATEALCKSLRAGTVPLVGDELRETVRGTDLTSTISKGIGGRVEVLAPSREPKPISKVNRKFALATCKSDSVRDLAKAHAQASKRKTLPQILPEEAAGFVERQESDALVLLCVLNDNLTVSRKYEVACEHVAMDLVRAQEAAEAMGSAQVTGGLKRVLVKVRAASSRYLHDRFQFRSAPMFMACLGGRIDLDGLVSITNSFADGSSRPEALHKLLDECEIKAKSANFLGRNYVLGTHSNFALEDMVKKLQSQGLGHSSGEPDASRATPRLTAAS